MDKAADGSVPYRGKAVKPLTDKEQATWRALMRLLIVLPRVIEADMIRAGQLTRSEYTVLMHLSEAEDRSMRINALAELVRLTESGMSRIVARLGGEGLVERRRSSEDGRGQVVTLTDAGLAQLEATFPGHLASVRHHVFDALTGVDLDSFTNALSRIAPDEPLAHLSNVEISSGQRAAGEPGGARRPRSPGKLRSIIGIIAEHQDRQAQYLANQQVDDHEQHPASGHAEAVSIDEAVDRPGAAENGVQPACR